MIYKRIRKFKEVTTIKLNELSEKYNLSSYERMKNKSIIKGFEIKGLFGEYDYKFKFEDLANIYVAENGSGKTTILNLLVGIMTENIEKLRKIPFDSIKIHLEKTDIELEKSELYENSVSDSYDLEVILRRVLPPSITKRLLVELEKNPYSHNVYNILSQYRVPEIEISRIMDRISTYSSIAKKTVTKLRKISKFLNQTPIYLPTYRRIEEELSSLGLTTINSRNFNENLNGNNINFGMTDVKDKILELTAMLKDAAIKEYSNMTAEILEDLLNKKIKQKFETSINPEIIKIIIGRIGTDKIKEEKLISFIEGNLKTDNDEFLKYYLNKLINIYNANRDIDDKIKKYVEVCNFYLVNKKMIYDEVLAKVKIVKLNKDEKDEKYEIDFTLLSSGEKQILSLFSKLYLEMKNKSIIIIDEPELSLSIEWQKRLLPDIINSGMCELLIATTHSPFIFKNELCEYAKDLSLFREESK